MGSFFVYKNKLYKINKEEVTMKTFSTKSLNVVAWMLQKGYEIKNMVQEENNIVIHFEYSDELIQALNEYRNNTELREFLSHFRKLKQIINTAKK